MENARSSRLHRLERMASSTNTWPYSAGPSQSPTGKRSGCCSRPVVRSTASSLSRGLSLRSRQPLHPCRQLLSMSNENIFIWNVCGLNGHARRNVVRDLIVQERVSLVCLQETKLSNFCSQLASECLGTSFEYALLPAVNTAGGVLLGWRTDA